MTTALESTEKAWLRQFLEDHFSLSELKCLAFDLGINFELFAYQTIREFPIELIAHLERRDQLSCLVTEVLRCRPDDRLTHQIAPMFTPRQDTNYCIRRFAKASGRARAERGFSYEVQGASTECCAHWYSQGKYALVDRLTKRID